MAHKKALLYNETMLWGRWWGSGGPRRHRLSSYVAPSQPLVHAAGIDVLGNKLDVFWMPSSLDREKSQFSSFRKKYFCTGARAKLLSTITQTSSSEDLRMGLLNSPSKDDKLYDM